MAVLQPKTLHRGFVANTASTLYTAPSGASSYAIVKEMILCNTTGTAVTVSVYSIENGGSVADNRKILSAVSIDPGTTVVFSMSSVLENAATLRAVASSASAVTATVSGVEFS